MKILRLTALDAISIFASSVPASANHWWGGYHWATNGSGLDVKVNVALAQPGAWSGFVGGALTDWDTSTFLTLGTAKVSSTSPKRCNPIAGEILVCAEAYGQRGWLGLATIWNDSKGHIFQATTKLNDSYFSSGFYNTPGWRAMVTCQEVGHDFGLDHQNVLFDDYNLGTCMDYTNAPDGGLYNTVDYGSNNRHPNIHDYDQLAIIYQSAGSDGYFTAHSSTSANPTNFGIRQFGTTPPSTPSAAPIGDSPAEWGVAVRWDGYDRPDVFVKDLGQGQKAVTHVFWALETRD